MRYMLLGCLSVGLDNVTVYCVSTVLVCITLQGLDFFFTSMVHLRFSPVSVCSLDLSYGTVFVFGIWKVLSSTRPVTRLYGAHRVVRLAVHCIVCPLLVDEDMVDLCSFPIEICMCPKLTFLGF